MLDVAKFKMLQPAHAEGRVCIDLKDPATGKVKYRQAGENYVFPDALLCGVSGDWVAAISGTKLELSDSADAIDPNFPYMIGKPIGYGVPSQGSSGLYRGAYSVANQVLAAQNGITSLRWKFQYDFTAPQANGTIGRIGLTRQDTYGVGLLHPIRFSTLWNGRSTKQETSDGRYCYSCTTAGNITVTDVYLGGTSTIDVSAIVGTTSSTNKNVGYAPATGKYYIYAQSATVANRKMYVFSDNTFGNHEATYSVSNINLNNVSAVFVYGNDLFTLSSTGIYCADFIQNTVPTLYAASETALGTPTAVNIHALPYGKYITAFGSQTAPGAIFDMDKKEFCGILLPPVNTSSPTQHCWYPFLSARFGVVLSSASGMPTTGALAMKKLDTPVTKTSANGMTVTYELEVFW